VDTDKNAAGPHLNLRLLCVALALLLSACAGVTPRSTESQTERPPVSARQEAQAQDVVMYALSLMDTGYRFGGKNPAAGLDCSGMVSYVFAQAVGLKLNGSAADIARRGHAVPLSQLRPGDLVFFNTLNKPYSHVGIYIGGDRFAHAPSSGGKVRLDSLKQGWYASRLEEARAYFD
jgi:cell wall-associated NlpC family hydrolase